MHVPISTLVSYVSDFIPFIAGLLLYRRLDSTLKLFFVFCLLKFTFGTFGTLLAFRGASNLWLIHIWTLIELILLMIVFSNWHSNPQQKWLRYAVVFFVAFWIAAKLLFEDFTSLDHVTSPVAGMMLIAVSAYTLATLNKEEDVLAYHKIPRFWVSLAVLIYYAGTIIIFALGDYFVTHKLTPAWQVHSGINILANLLYAGAFLCLRLR